MGWTGYWNNANRFVMALCCCYGNKALSLNRRYVSVSIMIKMIKPQMTTVLDDNVHNFGVDGSSDDLDVPIKVAIITIITNISPIIAVENTIFKIIVTLSENYNYHGHQN